METEKKLAEKLGFAIEPAELIEDITIRPSDESESTSGVVWARSAPGMTVTMLADLWRECLKLMAEQEAAESENKRLREALEKLNAEVIGITTAYSVALREAIGMTNLAVLIQRRDEAAALRGE